MKPRSTITLLLFAVTCQASLAQDSGPLPSRSAARPTTPADSDKTLLPEADNSRQRIETSLKNYLVAFDSRHDSNRKRLGLPLASSSDKLFNIAYDLSGRSVMVQWKFAQSSAYGNKVNYHAYVGEAGTVSLAISTNF